MFRADDVMAIHPDTFHKWAPALDSETNTARIRPTSEEAQARLVPGRKNLGDVAVIRLSGFITQKANMWTELFGGTSTEGLAAEVRAAMSERSIGAVLLDVDSPGGTVVGVSEAAEVIRASRGSKPLVALANPFMASAAYWLASQADEIVATPSSLTGSIGVMSVYVDESKALEAAGLDVEEITYGRRKAEGSGTKPLTDVARAGIQDRVDYYGEMFEADVARGRGISPARVRARYGQGAVFNAGPAREAGLVDRVGTLESVVAQLAKGYQPAPRARAETDPIETRARLALASVSDFRVE